MPKQNEQTFRLLPEWAIRQSGTSLIVSGGADAQYEVVLETSTPSFFSTLKSNEPFKRAKLNGYDQRVLEELVAAEIVVPLLKKAQVLKVVIVGDKEQLRVPQAKSIAVVDARQPYDLALVVRGNSTYADLLGRIGYPDLSKPHLFIDMAFHHTASIGPLVFPGETACIACLQGRVSTRWGDEAPPPSSKTVNNYGALVSELVAAELARIAENDTSLTNKTIAWNFQDRAVKQNQLLKVPLCPVCMQNNVDHAGALALPWIKDEGTTNAV